MVKAGQWSVAVSSARSRRPYLHAVAPSLGLCPFPFTAAISADVLFKTPSCSLRPATQGEFDVVVVWAIDQVPHDRATDVFFYISELMRWLVLLESYTEPRFSSIGSGGERMLAVAAWIAALSPIPKDSREHPDFARTNVG
jgi:hypothetical protein